MCPRSRARSAIGLLRERAYAGDVISRREPSADDVGRDTEGDLLCFLYHASRLQPHRTRRPVSAVLYPPSFSTDAWNADDSSNDHNGASNGS